MNLSNISKALRPAMAVTALAIVFCLIAISAANAYPTGEYSSGTYGSCDYGVSCSISLSSDGNISLNVTPTSSGSCTVQSDSASVLTDDSNGYTLTLADYYSSTNLTNGTANISATSGTFSSPVTLTNNAWGYRVDGLGSFGSGPTTAQSNVATGSLSGTYAAIKANGFTADTIASTSTAANPAVTTTVWYGVCADTGVPSGTYTTQVIYTAVAN